MLTATRWIDFCNNVVRRHYLGIVQAGIKHFPAKWLCGDETVTLGLP